MNNLIYEGQGIEVAPRNTASIVAETQKTRHKYRDHVNQDGYFDLYSLLEEYQNYQVVEDKYLPFAEAQTLPDGTIVIKDSVFDSFCDNDPRARFTVAHEFGHVMLHHFNQISLQRNVQHKSIRTYRNSEWQANEFAGWLLVPPDILLKHIDTPIERLSQILGASRQCIAIRKEKLNRLL